MADQIKEAQRRLQQALKLKDEIERLSEKLAEHKQWFAENFPEGFEYKGVGQAIVRWIPEFTVDVDKLIRSLSKEGLAAALRFANPRHSVVAKLKDAGFLREFDKFVAKTGEHPSVEFRRK